MLSTIEQMHDYVNQHLNKVSTVTVDPVEFGRLINGALVDYIEQMARRVDKDQVALDALQVLKVDPLVVNNTGAASPQGEQFIIPYTANPLPGVSRGYFHMLNAGVKLAKTVAGVAVPVACTAPGGWASITPLRTDGKYSYERDPFWEASNDEPYYEVRGYTMHVFAEADTFATQVKLEYLRYPVELSAVPGQLVQPEFPASVNQAVCDYAVRRQLEVIESPRYPTNVRERQLNA